MYRRNTTCTMIIHVRTAHHRCLAQSVAQDTEQMHGKHGSGALLSSFPLLLVVVLVEHVGCLSSGDRDRGLRIWNEREARRNECETRCWLSLERVRNSLLVVTPKSQIVSWLLVLTRSHSLSLDPEPLALACESTQKQWKMQYELRNSR